MKSLYVGPGPFWYLWCTLPNAYEPHARAFVDAMGPWFRLRNWKNSTGAQLKVRLCSVVSAAPIVAETSPPMREWTFPTIDWNDQPAMSKIVDLARDCYIGSPPFDPLAWGMGSVIYLYRDEWPFEPTPWRFWFAGPVRLQHFYRREVYTMYPDMGGTAGRGCLELVVFDGTIPSSFSDEFIRKNYSYIF